MEFLFNKQYALTEGDPPLPADKREIAAETRKIMDVLTGIENHPELHKKAKQGWRLIVKIQDDGEKAPRYHIDLVSKRGGGSNVAEARMKLLETQDHVAKSCDKGAIRIPYWGPTSGENSEQLSGEIRIAFNGTEEAKRGDQNFRFCLLAFAAIFRLYRAVRKTHAVYFDFDSLRQFSEARPFVDKYERELRAPK